MSYLQLICISILGWGVGSVFYKIANDSLHPIMVSMLVTALYVVLLPTAFLFTKVNTTVTFNGTLAALLGGLCMCIGSLAYFYALKRGGAGEVTLLTSLYPGLTLILSCLFMGEVLTIKKLIGILCAAVSIYFISQK